jgi:peptidoglycan/xylan/chitin deacetylase (PgdA/CDA1 family)
VGQIDMPRLEHLRTLALAAILLAAGGKYAAAEPACANPSTALGVSRVVELDTSGGPIYGAATKFVTEQSFLRPKEVLLTFDDGPSPAVTGSVLETLARFCTKATFFHVGRMAIAYPRLVKRVMAEGHTVGAHTWSHPLSLPRMKVDAARAEIERGFTAITLAAGRPIAPFFRFPGLSDNTELLTYLQHREIATFTVDVISDDSFISSTERLVKTTLARLESRGGGILLFHDIKPQTARALPIVLTELKRRGYSIVHLRSRHAFEADLSYARQLDAMLAKVRSRGEIALETAEAQDRVVSGRPPVTLLVPEARPVVRASVARAAPAKSDHGHTPIHPQVSASSVQRVPEAEQHSVRAPARWHAVEPTGFPPFRTTVDEPLRGSSSD